jgi:hypothetical protein
MNIDLTNLPDQTGADEFMAPVPGRVAHIDADFIAYQASAETKDELAGLAPRKTLQDMQEGCVSRITRLMRLTGSTSYVAHITPSGSTKGGRNEIALNKEYQGNRKSTIPPVHLAAIRGYIGEMLPSAVHLDQEADDGMTQANVAAIAAGQRDLSVIVSMDKDLRMAPGLHWCFAEETLVDVDGFGSIWVDRSKSSAKVLGWGTAFFWAQLLMGDTADNISGLPSNPQGKNIGPIAAHGYLDQCTTDQQCFEVIKYLWSRSPHIWKNWRDASDSTWKLNLVADMRLLWMRQHNDPDDLIKWLGTI